MKKKLMAVVLTASIVNMALTPMGIWWLENRPTQSAYNPNEDETFKPEGSTPAPMEVNENV